MVQIFFPLVRETTHLISKGTQFSLSNINIVTIIAQSFLTALNDRI